MKTIALCLYGFAFLVSFCLGGPAGLMYFFPFLALGITVFLGIAQLFLWLFAWLIVAKKDYREHREHGKWIL